MEKRKKKVRKITSSSGDQALRGLIGYNLKRAYMTVRSDFLKTMEEYDLRATTFSALMLIVDKPDMTQSQLAEALSIERSGVVVIVDELENREFITRNKVEGDRRTYALRATLSGVQFSKKVLKAAQKHEEKLLANMSEKQRATLIELLNLIEG